MVYDAGRKVVVLYGGAGEGKQLLGDTWEWNGTTWRECRAPEPTPGRREEFSFAYDAARGEVVLFGGTLMVGTSGKVTGDTWTWDGQAWKQKRPERSPSGRITHATAYDAQAEAVVLFGGYAGGETLAETWVWDGINWHQRRPSAAPIARGGHVMVYDAAQSKVSVMGGLDVNGAALEDLWRFGVGR